MENITLLNILSDNFPLILSTIVSIVSIGVNVFVVVKQTSSERKIKSMELYFNTQYEAYKELFEAVAELEHDLKPHEIRDIRRLISAAKKAEMLSPDPVYQVIDNFCNVYIDYVEKMDRNEKISPNLEEEFKICLATLEICLREELRRFNVKESKGIKQLRKILRKERRNEND